VFLLVGVLFIGVGGVLLFVAQRSAKQAKAAQAWPKVAGVVTATRIDESTETDTSQGGLRIEKSYSPHVTYEYEVAGVKYSGSHIGIGPGTASYQFRGPAERALAAYPVGKAIQVLVDPANPANAALTAKASMNMLLPIAFMAIGAVMLLVGIL
jgi:hypothetical protein